MSAQPSRTARIVDDVLAPPSVRGALASLAGRVSALVPMTPVDWARAMTASGTALSMGSMAVMGIAALARLDPALIHGAVTTLAGGGAAFGTGLVAQAAMEGEDEGLVAIRARMARRVSEKVAQRDVILSEVALLDAGLATPTPADEPPAPTMR